MLARMLSAPDGLTAGELEADIRSDPRIYYPEYRDACERSGATPLPEAVWADVCSN